MKKFKAMLAATAAVMALSAVSVPMSAFAASDPQVYSPDAWDPSYNDGSQTTGNNPSAKIDVSFTINPTYTVTIPMNVKFGDAGVENNAVLVDNVFLNNNKAVQVSVESNNDYRMLLNEKDNNEQTTLNHEKFIEYNVSGVSFVGKKNDFGAEGYPNEGSETTKTDIKLTGNGSSPVIISVPTGNNNNAGKGRAELIYTLPQGFDVPVAGTYSDTLTFTIAVVNATNSGNNQEPAPQPEP